MKKQFLFSAAVLGMLAMTACSNEEMPAPDVQDDGVTFSISLPAELKTRSFDDGLHATTITYAIFQHGVDAPVLTSKMDGAPTVNKVDTYDYSLTVNLVKGKTYDFMFWADNGNSIYSFSDDYKTITCNYNENTYLSDKNHDAFYNVIKDVTVSGAQKMSTTLRRPFAQINLGTFVSDIENAQKVGLGISTVDFTIDGAYTELDLFSGVARNPRKVGFRAAGLPNEDNDGKFPYQPDENDPVRYLSMAYVLTGSVITGDGADKVHYAQSEVMDASFNLHLNDGSTLNVPVPSMPLQRNYRTNIYGSLLTSPLDITIHVDKDFFQDDHIVKVTTPEEFAAALAEGGNVELGANLVIDNSFTIRKDVSIDLNGHQILSPTKDTYNDALMIYGGNVEIKNGTIKVERIASAYGAGVYVANATVTLEDVNIEGDCPLWVRKNANVTIKSGAYNSTGSQAVYVDRAGAKVTILGGEFHAVEYEGRKYCLNLLDSLLKDGAQPTDFIEVKGGTFYDYNPAESDSENPVANFVATGFKSVENTPDIWTVVPVSE